MTDGKLVTQARCIVKQIPKRIKIISSQVKIYYYIKLDVISNKDYVKLYVISNRLYL